MFILLFALFFLFSLLEADPLKREITLSKVTFKGSVVGKDRFFRAYQSQSGDLFDERRHHYFLEKIKEQLISEGYLTPVVKDELTFNDDRKTVSLVITLIPGSRYTVEQLNVSCGAEKAQKALYSLLSSTLKGRYCTKELLAQAAEVIKDYCQSHGYLQKKLSYTQTKNLKAKTVQLDFSIDLVAKKRYSFTGNSFFSDEQLTALCESFNRADMEFPAYFYAEDIRSFYRKKGFLEMKVSFKEAVDKTLIVIEEGVRTCVSSVSFKGDDQRENRELKKECAALCTDYDEELFHKALTRYRKELQAQGYWDATVTKQERFSLDQRRVELVILVVKGDQRVVQEIRIPHYPFLIKEGPFIHYNGLKKPRCLSLEELQEQKRYIQEYIRKQGHLYAPVTHSLTSKEGILVLEWNVDLSGGPVRFGKTTIIGLSKVKPSVIERELCYKEGDPWDHRLIDYSVQRLKNLGMFTGISLGPEYTDHTIQPLILKCSEDDPFELRTRLGFQLVSKSFTHLSWTTYKIGGSFLWKSPTGNADKIGLDADFTRYSRILAAHYEIPWLGPYPIRTFFKWYSDRFDQPLTSKINHRLYKESHDGACVNFLFSRSSCDASLCIGFEFTKLDLLSTELAKVIQFEPCLVNKATPYVYIEPSISFESIDNKVAPSYGWCLLGTLKAMVPTTIKNGWFVRAVIENTVFVPLFRSLVGAFRWKCGHIFNARFSTIIPTERFYLGGSTSLRGYETNMVPPLNDTVIEECRFWIPVGGKTVAALNAEIRFGIYDRLSGVVFTDGGVLTQNRFADIAAHRWFGATGFGIRCATPLAPIRFDIGWKWRKRDIQDKSYAFFLTMGQAF